MNDPVKGSETPDKPNAFDELYEEYGDWKFIIFKMLGTFLIFSSAIIFHVLLPNTPGEWGWVSWGKIKFLFLVVGLIGSLLFLFAKSEDSLIRPCPQIKLKTILIIGGLVALEIFIIRFFGLINSVEFGYIGLWIENSIIIIILVILVFLIVIVGCALS